jgi:hypothetical protein
VQLGVDAVAVGRAGLGCPGGIDGSVDGAIGRTVGRSVSRVLDGRQPMDHQQPV